MTPREVIRAIDSKNRVKKIEAQERATFDYIQACLIVKGVSITLGDKSTFPTIEETYPSLFEEITKEQEEKVRQQKAELSALRFRQFAQSYSNNLNAKRGDKVTNE